MIKGLDGFRAFAFLAVFFAHTNILPCGYLGVNAFFVLSGFLITPILIEIKKNNSLGNYLKIFWGRRVLRIFPLYYVYLIGMTIVLFVFSQQYDTYYKGFISQLPYALTYTYDFLHTTKQYIPNKLITHFWSLAVEEKFYLVWPFIIFFIKEKYLKKLLICIVPIGMIIRYVTFQLPFLPQFNFLINNDNLVYISPFSHMDAFMIGGYFGIYGEKIKVSKLKILSMFTGILCIGILTSKIATNNYHFEALGYSPFMLDSKKYVWGYPAFALLFAFLLNGLKKRIFFPIIFENTVMSYLGKISYGLYIFHFPLIYLCERYLSNDRLIVVVSSLLLTILFSSLSFELFEKKINKLKEKFFYYDKRL